MSDRIVAAMKYLGLHEEQDRVALKKLLGFDPSIAWCAGFMNAIEKECGRAGTGKLTARSYLKYGYPVDKPKIGDIVVLKRGRLPWQGHVGIYIEQEGDYIKVLGGNQKNSVCYSYYPKADVLGYRR